MERVALFGGTFDPPHIGHLIVADCVREQLNLDRVEFLIAADPPHKRDVARSSFDDRRRMVEIAIEGAPSLTVNDSEGNRPGPSYTVDTLRLRRRDSPNEHLWFLIGADSLVDLPSWHQPETIYRLARLAIAARPSFPITMAETNRLLPGLADASDVVETPLIDIASRDLRQRVQLGLSIAYRTPEPVATYIRERHLYRTPG